MLDLLIAGRQGLFYFEFNDSFDVITQRQVFPTPCWGITAVDANTLLVASRRTGFEDVQEVPAYFFKLDSSLVPFWFFDFPRARDCHQILMHERRLYMTSCATNEVIVSYSVNNTFVADRLVALPGGAGWDIGHFNSMYVSPTGEFSILEHGYGKPSRLHTFASVDDFIKQDHSQAKSLHVGLHAHNIIPVGPDRFIVFSSKEGRIAAHSDRHLGSDLYVKKNGANYFRGGCLLPRFTSTQDLLVVGGTENVESRADRGEAKSELTFFLNPSFANDFLTTGNPILPNKIVQLDIGPIHEIYSLSHFDLCRPHDFFRVAKTLGFHK